MKPRLPVLFLLVGWKCGEALAAPVVEIKATTAGPYAPGQRVVLELFLSQAWGEADLPLRLIQFDFEDTSPELLLDDEFVFDYSGQALCRMVADSCGDGYAEFPSLTGEVPVAATVYEREREDLAGQIVLPRSGAIAIGSLGVTLPNVSGEYRVDVINRDTPYPFNEGAQVHFDFLTPTAWLARDFLQVGDPRFVASPSDTAPGFAFEFITTGQDRDCLQESDCDDDNPCTMDFCAGGACVYGSRSGDCDDGDLCSVNDRCVGGACVGQPDPACCRTNPECDDGKVCTEDECFVGLCVHRDQAALCDDGDVCTVNDACLHGACVGQEDPDCCRTNAECDDGDVCTVDECREGECLHRDGTALCDDGDPCTFADICTDGMCVGQPSSFCCQTNAECEDGNPCTADGCSAGQCWHRDVPALCDDGDPCTIYDFCAEGECAGQPVEGCCGSNAECDDHDDRTTDRCVNHVCEHETAEVASSTDPAATADDGAGVVDASDDPATRPAGDGDGSQDSGVGALSGLCGAVGVLPMMVMMAGLAIVRRWGRQLFRA